MKSMLYILTALLPLAAIATPVADPEPDDDLVDLEERDGGGGGSHDRPACRATRPFDYWRYPCPSGSRSGHANRGDPIQINCRYQDWWRTPRGWMRDSDRPRNCPRPGNQC